MSQQMVVLEKEYTPTGVMGISRLLAARAKLSRAIREFWASPEGQEIRLALSRVAYESGYAERVRNIMSTISGDLENAAAQSDLSRRYRAIWGK